MEEFPVMVAAVFAGDVLVVALAGWLTLRAAEGAGGGAAVSALGWLVACLLIVAGSGVGLGAVGWLGPRGQLSAHVVWLVALGWWRRKAWRDDWRAWQEWGRAVRAAGAHSRERWGWRGLFVVMGGGAVVAALAVPLVFDALTYRLPRIAQWLQEGRIAHLNTDDARQNYMAIGPDLVIAWLLGATSRGYLLSGLVQAAGGGLLAGATYFFGIRTGLSRWAALGAVALVLGMGNVAPQLASMHTDLFAAGVFAASAAVWVAGLERGRGTWLGGAGLGFALASKGTVFYLLPGAILWAWWWARRHRASRVGMLVSAGGFVVAVVLFCAPLWARNYALYGRLTAPVEALEDHYGPALDAAAHGRKLGLNLQAMAAQWCDPNSQPPWLSVPAEKVGRALIAALPARDPFTFENVDRVATLGLYFDFPQPDADFTGPGVLIAAMFLGGVMFAAVRWRRSDGRLVLVWAAGVATYLVGQNAVIQWHPWGLRYVVLVAPWLAVVAAWAAEQAPRRVRVGVWTLLLAGAGWVFLSTNLLSRQSGWQGMRMAFAETQGGWREWADSLEPSGSPLRVALPVNSAVSQFFRTEEARAVRVEKLSALPPATAEEVVGAQPGAWLVVPATRFMGREGRVVARTWILRGDESHKISVAAYRALGSGEEPTPVLYSDRPQEAGLGFARALALRSWRPSVALVLHNPARIPWAYTVSGEGAPLAGAIAPGGRQEVQVPVQADALTRLTLAFRSAGAEGEEDGRVPYLAELR